jgi:DNA-directed RNA polymerase subunit alpha
MAEATAQIPDVKAVVGDAGATIAQLVSLRREIHKSMAARAPAERLLGEFGKEVARRMPSESAAETRRGTLLWILGYSEAAAGVLEQCRASRERHFFLGASYLDLERPQAAVEPLGEAYGSDKEDVVIAKAYVEALARSGDADGAEKVWNGLARRAGEDDADVAYLKGLILEARGDYDGAWACYEEAREKDPGHPRAIFKIACLLDLRGEDARAMELFQQLRALRPIHVSTMLNLAVLYEDRGEYDKAIECCQAVLEFFPNHTRARLYLSDALASKQMYFDEESEKREARLRQLLAQPLAEFNWSRRVREAFAKLGVSTVGELASKSEEELMEVPNFGKTSLNEVKEFLAARGLSLAYSERSGGHVTTIALEESVFDRALSDIQWSERAEEFFRARGLNTVGDLARLTAKEITAHEGAGPALLREIEDRFAALGLRLRQG